MDNLCCRCSACRRFAASGLGARRRRTLVIGSGCAEPEEAVPFAVPKSFESLRECSAATSNEGVKTNRDASLIFDDEEMATIGAGWPLRAPAPRVAEEGEPTS